MTLEFFDICRVLVFTTAFPSLPSSSYVKKHWNRAYKRLLICEKVAREARKQGVNIPLAAAVAARETRFSNSTSTKGAKGPLGVIAKYHCPKGPIKNCNYIRAGVKALKTYLKLNEHDLCPTLAQYNRGNKGVCKEGRSEYSYAQDVLELYERACAEAPSLCAEC